MIYKLLNYLFGWDYIVWENSCNNGIARLRTDASGRVWYYRYKETGVIDYLHKGQVKLWLTCSNTKYSVQENGKPQ